jgi:hypothetical protein
MLMIAAYGVHWFSSTKLRPFLIAAMAVVRDLSKFVGRAVIRTVVQLFFYRDRLARGDAGLERSPREAFELLRYNACE